MAKKSTTTKLTKAQEANIKAGHRPDYIPYGSDAHAGLLGLRKATPDDKITLKGWALGDIPPMATEVFLRDKLRQLVTDLESGKPRLPENAPDMVKLPEGVKVVRDMEI